MLILLHRSQTNERLVLIEQDIFQGHAIRKIKKEDVHEFAARGQYGEGWQEGEKVKGYREEKNVPPDSNTETFAALKFFIDNWRWSNIPFYIRSGKRMQETPSPIK